jgi:hypothetical protein
MVDMLWNYARKSTSISGRNSTSTGPMFLVDFLIPIKNYSGGYTKLKNRKVVFLSVLKIKPIGLFYNYQLMCKILWGQL